MGEPKRLDSLPVFPSPPSPGDYGGWRLNVDGLVSRPLTFGYDEIRSMPSTDLTADFKCEEGWEVQGLCWTGVPLDHLIKLAGPLKEARYVAVGSGEFVASLALSDIELAQPLLSYLLDGSPLLWEHGGPLRLVLADGSCYQSVKWVDRLKLAADTRMETAKRVALARIGRQEES